MTAIGRRGPGYDLVVVGGGAIGLSIAWQATRLGATVALIERSALGRAASWAGAGILPARSWYDDSLAIDDLAAESWPLHSQWSAELLAETGIDNGYACCGAAYLPVSHDEANRNQTVFARWRKQGVGVAELDVAELVRRCPGCPPSFAAAIAERGAQWVEQESQVRNPRHLRALASLCGKLGVVLRPHCDVRRLERSGPRVVGVRLESGEVVPCGAVCLASGAWADELLPSPPSAGISRIEPIRGQMIQLAAPTSLVPGADPRQIVHHNFQYLVTRIDGRVLVGSTLERVGFDCQTTSEALDSLLELAGVFGYGSRGVESTWAGLRPASTSRRPLLGWWPGIDGLAVAVGHFRAGLQCSPATATRMARLLAGESAAGCGLAAFSVP